MLAINNKVVLMGSVAIYSIIFFASVFANYVHVGDTTKSPVSSISVISDKYFTNITPAKYTFSIWGIIYSVGILVLMLLWRLAINSNFEVFNNISLLVLLSSIIMVLNPLWILAWVNEKIPLSWLVMISLLILLIISSIISRSLIDSQTIIFKAFINIYLGWITVAFCINTWALLIYYGVDPFSVTSMYASLVVLTTVGLIALWMLFGQNNLFFILVIAWAFLGLYMQKDIRVYEYTQIRNFSLSWIIICGVSIIYYIVVYLKKIPTK